MPVNTSLYGSVHCSLRSWSRVAVRSCSFLLHSTEHQSARFTVRPFCMSRLVQLFVTPVKAGVHLPLHPPRPCWDVCVCVCSLFRPLLLPVTVPRILCAWSLLCLRAAGQCQGAPLLSWASLQAMPWARKQETTSREGNCVLESGKSVVR